MHAENPVPRTHERLSAALISGWIVLSSTQKDILPDRRCSLRLKRAGRAGFTLLELMVVMVIMGIVLAVQLPRLGGRLTGSSLRSAAGAVSTLACSARFRAADTGRPHILVLDSRKNSMRLLGEGDHGPLISKRLPHGVSVEKMESEGNVVDDTLRIIFSPLGTATPAELLLSGGVQDRLLLTVSAADGVVHAQSP